MLLGPCWFTNQLYKIPNFAQLVPFCTSCLLPTLSWACVPDHELLVVGHGAGEGLVQQVPRHVLKDGSVAGEDCLGVNHLKLKRRVNWWTNCIVSLQNFPTIIHRDFFGNILGSSPGLWAATAASYCPSRAGELPKQNMTKSHIRWDGKLCSVTSVALLLSLTLAKVKHYGPPRRNI